MNNKPAPDHDQLLLQMCSLCARCEQCEADLREKMRRRGATSAMIQEIIDYLYEHNFLNELRYATAYATDKNRFNGWGRIKLRVMLASKHISRQVITEALGSIDTREYHDGLLKLLRQKARGLDTEDPVARQKLLRALYARGYEPAIISAAMRELRQE